MPCAWYHIQPCRRRSNHVARPRVRHDKRQTLTFAPCCVIHLCDMPYRRRFFFLSSSSLLDELLLDCELEEFDDLDELEELLLRAFVSDPDCVRVRSSDLSSRLGEEYVCVGALPVAARLRFVRSSFDVRSMVRAGDLRVASCVRAGAYHGADVRRYLSASDGAVGVRDAREIGAAAARRSLG